MYDDTACTTESNPKNFGGKHRGSISAGLGARGTRAHIQAPAGNFELDHLHAAAARVVAEAYASGESGRGLIQTGFAQSNELPLDDCGYRTTLTHYWEYKLAVGGAPFHCAWLDGTPLAYGASRLYTVYRKVTSLTTWAARIEGSEKLSLDVHFDTADNVHAGGEIVRSGAPFGFAHGGVSACVGCSGSPAFPTAIQWQMTTAAGSTKWGDIAEPPAENVNSDGNWQIGSIPAWSIVHPYSPP